MTLTVIDQEVSFGAPPRFDRGGRCSGVRPTVEGVQRRLETHLLDFPPSDHTGDLYGQSLTLQFVARLRDEQRFSSIDALVAQIQLDIEQARQLFQQMPMS